MKLPKGFPKVLSSIIDCHTNNNILPSWYCINYFQIKKDFQVLINKLKLNNLKVADIFGRSTPYASIDKIHSIDIFEPRQEFIEISKKIHGSKINELNFKTLQLEYYDLILINLEYPFADLDNDLLNINDKFRKDQIIFAYEYKEKNHPDKIFYYNGEGQLVNSINKLIFYKQISNHMHEGVHKIDGNVVTFYDLSLNY